jgi:hypothetical protein
MLCFGLGLVLLLFSCCDRLLSLVFDFGEGITLVGFFENFP